MTEDKQEIKTVAEASKAIKDFKMAESRAIAALKFLHKEKDLDVEGGMLYHLHGSLISELFGINETDIKTRVRLASLNKKFKGATA